jgi:hypothetical protein
MSALTRPLPMDPTPAIANKQTESVTNAPNAVVFTL